MMQDTIETSGMRTVARVLLWGGLALLLSLPGWAMMLGAEGVDWTLSDFVIMGLLLATLGVVIEGAMRFLRSAGSRWLAIGGVLTLFVLTWIELAVGIFGTPFAGS